MKLLNVAAGVLSMAFALHATPSAAQSPPAGGTRFEVGGFGGASGGLPSDQFADAFVQGLRLAGGRNITSTPGSSAKWLAGGHLGAGFGSRTIVTFELVTSQISNPSFRGSILAQPFAASLGLRLTEYLGGVQYTLAPGRVAPYVAAGLGIARLSATVSGSLPGDISISQSDVATNFGGGVRLFTGSAWGVRPDFRVVRVPDETYFRTSVGVFFQMR